MSAMPHDIDAEMAVLGAAMMNAADTGLIVERLTSGHFYRPAHQVVFEAISALVAKAIPADTLLVKAEVERRRDENGERVDTSALLDMVHIAPIGSVSPYVDRLMEMHYRRGLVVTGIQMTSLGNAVHADIGDVQERTRQLMDGVGGITNPSSAQPLSELIYPFLERLEDRSPQPGVTTGWADVDALLVRLRPGQLIVVGARPGQGKSVVMVNLALHVGLKLGRPVLFASLEMTKDELLARMVAHQAKVSLHKLLNRDMAEADWERVEKRAAEMAAAEHLVIDDDPSTGVAELREKLSRMRRAGQPFELVLVDYLQLMTSRGKTESRQLEVSALSRSLKLLAKEFAVPVVVGAQLNRGPEQRANKRPTKSDLRESGSLENDADVVLLLHREDAYNPESPRAGEIDLIFDKHRQGPTATITAAFQGHYSRIADMAAESWSPWKGQA